MKYSVLELKPDLEMGPDVWALYEDGHKFDWYCDYNKARKAFEKLKPWVFSDDEGGSNFGV